MISFADFLRVAHGKEITPYSWQLRLAERCASGEPPTAISVPTGAGKTFTIDALVWALAQQADRPAAQRTVGVRIVWAIDRRILVDEVYEHAQSLAGTLKAALADKNAPVHEVAKRLARISGGEVPLVATRWRGGLQERPERCGPSQPQVITSTIAQIGSRLLFRGFGVGRRSLALEAGLAACDTTICLDEAHLAEPFRETVASIKAHRAASEKTLELPGLHAITLTATPSRDAADAITLDGEDRVALRKRLVGEKRAQLLLPGDNEAGHVKLLAARSADYVREGFQTVACVVNTVRRARAVFDMLVKELGDEADVALLIGPQRPADRDLVLEKHHVMLFEGVPAERPLVCVATQTFEVGLDADVAAMVTESASATALVQRFGRLNRRGEIAGRATIVRDEGRALYADDEPAAWSWLEGLVEADGEIDVSVASLERNAPPLPSDLASAATLTSEVVELFAQTSPLPSIWREPDPEAFLRGPEAKVVAEVGLCWRSDLRSELDSREFDEYRSSLLELVPPQRQELLTLSVEAARALLVARYLGDSFYPQPRAARTAMSDADVEDATNEVVGWSEDHSNEQLVPFMLIRGGEVHRGTLGKTSDADGVERSSSAIVDPSALRAGDLLVLPTLAGGVDDNGLAPAQPRGEHATDVATDRRSGSQAIVAPVPIRLTPEALARDEDRFISQVQWRRVAKACEAAERELLDIAGPAQRKQRVDALIERLLEEPLLAEHDALKLMAPGAVTREKWTVMLRSVTPGGAGGEPQLDEADYGIAGEEDEHLAWEAVVDGGADEVDVDDAISVASRSDVDVEQRNLERVWVLLPVLETDSAVDRPTGDGTGPPTIDRHATDVSNEVRECAELLRLPRTATNALVLAARVHDHGKADQRTQDFYRRGVRTLGRTPIAKSEFGTRDPRTAAIARRRSGLPEHLRHEIASVAVLEDALASGTVQMDLEELDIDLALYLVGVHHGLGRPMPAVPEGGRLPQPFAINAAGVAGSAVGNGRDGWANGAWLERFWRMFDRYGAWGIAYLEALLVLNDRVVSSRGK